MQVIPIFVILTVILVSNAVTPAVYAESFSFVKPDFVFKITNIIEDIRLGLASAQDKIELIKEFAKDKQIRIDTALSRGESVPIEIEERRKALLDTSSIGETIKSELDRLGEMNEVRILYSQFPRCLETCTESEKELFNQKVNSLESWKSKCLGEFDIDSYENTNESFDKLAQKCPDLKNFSKNHLKSVVTGRV
jgi:hypothetical protein